eukprot:m.14331 g.14331  ORF g.14331 m.14331 type:complete len:294 (+) comp6205_c0_seq1:167-1048(+)
MEFQDSDGTSHHSVSAVTEGVRCLHLSGSQKHTKRSFSTEELQLSTEEAKSFKAGLSHQDSETYQLLRRRASNRRSRKGSDMRRKSLLDELTKNKLAHAQQLLQQEAGNSALRERCRFGSAELIKLRRQLSRFTRKQTKITAAPPAPFQTLPRANPTTPSMVDRQRAAGFDSFIAQHSGLDVGQYWPTPYPSQQQQGPPPQAQPQEQVQAPPFQCEATPLDLLAALAGSFRTDFSDNLPTQGPQPGAAPAASISVHQLDGAQLPEPLASAQPLQLPEPLGPSDGEDHIAETSF